MNATDFDPGPASSIHETEQMQAYVVKLRADGSLAWVRTFIGVSEDGYTYGTDVALDANGAIYATGVFGGSVDFDPVGAGGELTTEPSSDFPANRSEKMYLVKLAAGGTFEWVRTHTGGGSSFGSGVSVSGERVWLGGSVGGSCRFDASVPETPSNTAATFISSSSASGAFGGYGLINNNVNGGRVASTASSVYLTSWLDREADLDPSSGTDQRTLPLSGPVAVKLDRDGAFVWSQTFSRFAGYAVDTAVTGLDGLLLPAAGPWLDFSSSSDSQRGVVFLVNADSSPGFTLDLGAEALPRSVALGSGLLAVAGQLETPLAAYGPPSFFVARYAYAN
jgi:hypothetical protein